VAHAQQCMNRAHVAQKTHAMRSTGLPLFGQVKLTTMQYNVVVPPPAIKHSRGCAPRGCPWSRAGRR